MHDENIFGNVGRKVEGKDVGRRKDVKKKRNPL